MTPEEKDALKTEIKELIIDKLNVQHITANEVENNAPLFGEDNPLGLDSIDAIEIVMGLQEKYEIRITDQNPAREILKSIDTIADFIEKEKQL